MRSHWITKFTRQDNDEKIWTSVQSYEDARTALIAKEHSRACDGHAVTAASAVEKRANELVGEIRNEDEREIYGKFKDKQGHDSGSWRITSLVTLI
jgi:hypothetical protein